MSRTLSERALILAPRGRDAVIAAAMLEEADIAAHCCASLAKLTEEMAQGAGFCIVTEEALLGANLQPLAASLAAQPEWSDFPFVLLTPRGGGLERNPGAARLLETLGNVTFVERPFHPTTLVSLSRSALRARRRQYEARARLETIREGEERLRIAFAAGQLGDWTLVVASRELRASDKCKSHYGRAPADPFAYADLMDSVHPDDRERMLAAVGRALSTGEDYEIQYRCIWPDRSCHWVEVRGRPELDAAGAAIRMTGVSRDVTDVREAEAALRDQAADLEARFAERTAEAEAARAQLHEAQKLEVVGQLTGGVAHDFNNLLTPIVGTLDILQRRFGETDARAARLIDTARQSAERAKTLVQRLLGFARRQTLKTTAVDLAQLLDGMRELIASSVGSVVEVRIAVEPGLPAVLVDANQLELAILNLCVNARDAMPGGGVLMIAAGRVLPDGVGKARLAPGDYVRLAVADTGDGMDAATLKRAVEPFFSTKETGRGTGLGLSMVHGLAAQLGGGFALSSTPGEGTRAELYLPVAPTAAEARSARRAARRDADRPLKLLVVDDEDLVRVGTAEMLRDLGHEVAEAKSGAEALTMLRAASAIDAVITDYRMPRMDGAELTRKIAAEWPGLPILLITGYTGTTEHFPGLSRLAKPFGQAELSEALDRLTAAVPRNALPVAS